MDSNTNARILGVSMYRANTRGIEVSVLPVYIDERSKPEDNQHFWAYRVIIVNHGKHTIQIKSRYWHITDELGSVEEVSGQGVVGEQPVLRVGDSYEYTSGCPLNAQSGIMHGYYTVQTDSGEIFNVAIPAFSLDLPDIQPTVN